LGASHPEEENMFITTTTSKPRADQIESVEAYLAAFLPRLKELPGVVAVYHYLRPEQPDDVTIIVWEDQAALKKYRESVLFQEAIAYEKENRIPSVREGFPLVYPASQN
jgi:quinol monooxygenase YgiN